MGADVDGFKEWCVSCKREFPVAKEPATWIQGELRSLSRAPADVRRKSGGVNWSYLCGECWFKFVDEELVY